MSNNTTKSLSPNAQINAIIDAIRIPGIRKAAKPRAGARSATGVHLRLKDPDEMNVACGAAVGAAGKWFSGIVNGAVSLTQPLPARFGGGRLVETLSQLQDTCRRAAIVAVKKHRDPDWQDPRDVNAKPRPGPVSCNELLATFGDFSEYAPSVVGKAQASTPGGIATLRVAGTESKVTDEDLRDEIHEAGRQSAALEMLGHVIRLLPDGGEKRAALLERELADARRALRRVCENHGDASWNDSLNLADVVEKHLERYLGRHRAPPGTPPDRPD
jgi:hypothetical protein